MNYIVETAPSAEVPHSHYSWTLGPVTVERTVGKIHLSMDLNAPSSVKFTLDKQEYLVNLSAYDVNGGLEGLQTTLKLDNDQITQIKKLIAELRKEFELKTRYERIIFLPPTLLSQYRYRAILVARKAIELSTLQQEFDAELTQHPLTTEMNDQFLPTLEGGVDPRSVRVQRHKEIPNSFEVSANDFRHVIELLDNQHGLAHTATTPYAQQYALVNGFLPWFEELERKKAPVFNKTFDQSSGWFQECLTSMSKREYKQYVHGLKQHPNLVVNETMALADDLPEQPPAHVRLTLGYFNQLQALEVSRKRQASPKLTFLEQNFTGLFRVIMIVASVLAGIALFPVIIAALLLKVSAKILTLITPNHTYRSPGFPSLYNLILFQSLYMPGDPTEMQVGLVGAVFDMAANLLLNLVALVAIPIVLVELLVASAFALFKTVLDILNPLKHYGLKQDVKAKEAPRDKHMIFGALTPLTNLSLVSKRCCQVVQESLDPSKKKIPSREKVKVQPQLTATPTTEPTAEPTVDRRLGFRFFTDPRLPLDLQDRLIQTAVDQAMESDYIPGL